MTRWKTCLCLLSLLVACSDNDPENPEQICRNALWAWSSDWDTLEKEVLNIINTRRATGDTCRDGSGQETDFDPRDPMRMDSALQCAARVHSEWMAQTGTMSHNSPGGPLGDTPTERMRNAGYEGRGWAENIAAGQRTPESVVQSWMSSTAGHCTAIMGNYTIIGVGYAIDGTPYWTLTFGN